LEDATTRGDQSAFSQAISEVQLIITEHLVSHSCQSLEKQVQQQGKLREKQGDWQGMCQRVGNVLCMADGDQA